MSSLLLLFLPELLRGTRDRWVAQVSFIIIHSTGLAPFPRLSAPPHSSHLYCSIPLITHSMPNKTLFSDIFILMEGQFGSLGGSWISATGRLSKASYQSDSSLSHSLPVLQQQLGNLTSVCPLLSQCACWPAMLGSPPHFLNHSESHQPLGPSLNHFNRTICFP